MMYKKIIGIFCFLATFATSQASQEEVFEIYTDRITAVFNVALLSLDDQQVFFNASNIEQAKFDDLEYLELVVEALYKGEAAPRLTRDQKDPAVRKSDDAQDQELQNAVSLPKEYVDNLNKLKALQTKDSLVVKDMQFALQAIAARYESNWNVFPDSMKAKEVMWSGSVKQYNRLQDFLEQGIKLLQVKKTTEYMKNYLQAHLHELINAAVVFYVIPIIQNSKTYNAAAVVLTALGYWGKRLFGTPDIRDIGDGHLGRELWKKLPTTGIYRKWQQELTDASNSKK